MTDRELLEKAAKAHGGVNFGCERWYDAETDDVWNPIEDDGDALRLAVRLKLNIAQGDFSAGVNDEGEVDEAALVRSEDERLSVVRRLIVRAAASLAED